VVGVGDIAEVGILIFCPGVNPAIAQTGQDSVIGTVMLSKKVSASPRQVTANSKLAFSAVIKLFTRTGTKILRKFGSLLSTSKSFTNFVKLESDPSSFKVSSILVTYGVFSAFLSTTINCYIKLPTMVLKF
jgi:hypothetical protein